MKETGKGIATLGIALSMTGMVYFGGPDKAFIAIIACGVVVVCTIAIWCGY